MNLAATRALVQRHESLRLYPYDDATGQRIRKGDTIRGQISIGWGYNLSDRGIERAHADEWLEDDLGQCYQDLFDLFDWFASLDDARQAVLVDIRYNSGLDGFLGFHRLIGALTVRDFAKAAAEILDSEIALKRRTELALMMRTGQWS